MDIINGNRLEITVKPRLSNDSVLNQGGFRPKNSRFLRLIRNVYFFFIILDGKSCIKIIHNLFLLIFIYGIQYSLWCQILKNTLQKLFSRLGTD